VTRVHQSPKHKTVTFLVNSSVTWQVWFKHACTAITEHKQ